MSVALEAPAHRYAPGRGGNCAVLCRIGNELVQHSVECLARFGTQHDIGSFDSRIAGGGIGLKLMTHKFRKGDAPPTPMAQKLMRSCHRFDAAIESHDKLSHSAARLLGTRGNR